MLSKNLNCKSLSVVLNICPLFGSAVVAGSTTEKKFSSWGCSQGCTHSNIFSFSIPGRARANSRAPPSPRAFQDSLRQTTNPNCESVDKPKGNNSSAMVLPPHRLAGLQKLTLLSWQVNIPLLHFEAFPQFYHICPCMVRHQGVSSQSLETVACALWSPAGPGNEMRKMEMTAEHTALPQDNSSLCWWC